MHEHLFDNCEHKMLNPRHAKRDDRYEGLAACVILQALRDYDKCNMYRDSAIRFLKSERFGLFSEISGELWMAYVDRYGLPNISTDSLIGTGRKKDDFYGEKRETIAGTAEA